MHYARVTQLFQIFACRARIDVQMLSDHFRPNVGLLEEQFDQFLTVAFGMNILEIPNHPPKLRPNGIHLL